MKKIGLTGNAGSGKSTVRHLFEAQGLPCLDADLVAHEIYQRRPDVLNSIQVEFGDDVVREGQLDRAVLAERAFASPERIEALNSLIHPIVGDEINHWFKTQEDQGFEEAVVEATLIFESGRQGGYDEIWVIIVDAEVQNRRLRSRGWSQREINSRLSQQLAQSKKSQLADILIDNSSDMAALQAEFDKHISLSP